MPITTLPPAPSRATDTPQGFSDKMDALLGALAGFVSETNSTAATVSSQASAVATNTALAEGYKLAAAASAAAAAQSVEAAAAAANVTKWISGTTYAQGDVVWSPTSFFNYRRRTASGVSTVDPATDDTNWKLLGAPNSAPQQRINSNTSAVSGVHYLMENPAAGLLNPYTLSLGATPVDGETRQVTCLASIRTLKIDPQGKKIRNLPGLFTVDDLTFTRLWVFNAGLDSWI